MIESMSIFFAKWLGRLKAFSMLAGAWGFLFSVNSLIGFQAAFEYDDGLSFSTAAFMGGWWFPLEGCLPNLKYPPRWWCQGRDLHTVFYREKRVFN